MDSSLLLISREILLGPIIQTDTNLIWNIVNHLSELILLM